MSNIVHMAHVERATEDDNNEYANPICRWDPEWYHFNYTTNWDKVTCKHCLKRRESDSAQITSQEERE